VNLNASLWTAQALAAVTLGREGAMMLVMPIPELAGHLGDWVAETSPSNVHALGVVGAVGAFGIVVPSLLRILPKLAGVAAFAVAVLQALTAVFHLVRGELQPFAVNVALVGLLLFIGCGRTFRSLIEPHAHIRC
jgi:hypothetical protein